MVLAPVLFAILVQVPSSGAADAEREQFQALETRVSGAIQIRTWPRSSSCWRRTSLSACSWRGGPRRS